MLTTLTALLWLRTSASVELIDCVGFEGVGVYEPIARRCTIYSTDGKVISRLKVPSGQQPISLQEGPTLICSPSVERYAVTRDRVKPAPASPKVGMHGRIVQRGYDQLQVGTVLLTTTLDPNAVVAVSPDATAIATLTHPLNATQLRVSRVFGFDWVTESLVRHPYVPGATVLGTIPFFRRAEFLGKERLLWIAAGDATMPGTLAALAAGLLDLRSYPLMGQGMRASRREVAYLALTDLNDGRSSLLAKFTWFSDTERRRLSDGNFLLSESQKFLFVRTVEGVLRIDLSDLK